MIITMIWCKGLNERCNQNFFSTLFLYLLFHYPNLFLYSQRDPKLFLYSQRGTKLFLYSQRGPNLFLYSLLHYPKLFIYSQRGPKLFLYMPFHYSKRFLCSFSLFAISLPKLFSLYSEGHKTISLFSERPKTFSLFFFSIHYFITQNFFSILRGAQSFFSIHYFITQTFFSILRGGPCTKS